MMNVLKSLIATVAVALLLSGMSSCLKKEGPAERAGKKIDETVEKGGHQVEKVGKKIQEDVKGK